MLQLWLFSHFFIQLLGAQDIQCTVTRDDRGTLYSIPEFKEEKCYYSWTNFTRSVLANHEGKMDGVVVTKSNRTLLTYECLKEIRYLRDCISEVSTTTKVKVGDYFCEKSCDRK
ncbi:hypothetical protein PAMP_001377 [Pampus punctatissimus]